MFHFHSGTSEVVGGVGRGGPSSRRVLSGVGCGIGMSSPGTGGGSGIVSGSGTRGCSLGGGGLTGRGAAVRTPRCWTLPGADSNEARAQAMPPPTSTRGMISAHHPLRAGGVLEGMSLRRHSSHSPFRSSGSSCFSQIPIRSTICISAYHGAGGSVTRSSGRSGRFCGSYGRKHRCSSKGAGVWATSPEDAQPGRPSSRANSPGCQTSTAFSSDSIWSDSIPISSAGSVPTMVARESSAASWLRSH